MNKLSNILITSEHFYPIIGGTTIYVQELIRNLLKLNYCVHFLTYQMDRQVFENDNKLKIYTIKTPHILSRERAFPLLSFTKLFKIALSEHLDIIHIGYGFYSTFLTAFIKLFLKVSVILTVQNVPPEEHSIQKKSFLQKIYLFGTKVFGALALNLNIDKLVCVSKSTASLVLQRGVPKKKIVMIPNGVDLKLFSPKDKEACRRILKVFSNEKIILTVAGIVPHKGLIYLINAIPSLKEKFEKISLWFIGPIRDEIYFSELKKTISQLKIEENVKFWGSIGQNDLAVYYSAADLYVQPSLEEGFCMSILEAIACNKPVIGTNVGEIPDLLKNYNQGYLLDKEGLNKLGEIIRIFFENPANFFKKNENNTQLLLKKYEWSSIVRKTSRLYEKLRTG